MVGDQSRLATSACVGSRCDSTGSHVAELIAALIADGEVQRAVGREREPEAEVVVAGRQSVEDGDRIDEAQTSTGRNAAGRPSA